MRWKRRVGIFLALIAVSVLAVYAAVSSYDFNKLKPLIETTVLDSTGRELTLRGDVKVRFGLSPSLVVEDVRFQNSSWGKRPDMARIKSLRVHVSLISLIFGNVRVKRLVIVEPDISIETDRSGRSNLEFEKPKGEAARKPTGESESHRFSLDHITIEKGLLTYRDGESGKSHSINLERLDARLSGVYQELKVKGGYNGMPFEVSGRLSNPLPATYRISDFKASLENSDLRGTAEVTTGKRVGLTICKAIRERGKDFPIIVLSATHDTAVKIQALNLGADDYLTKPFSLVELLARIRALLRREKTVIGPVLRADNLEMDVNAHSVRRGRHEIQLNRKEFAILEHFLRRPGTTFTRAMILEKIWGRPMDPFTNTVDVHIRYLRKKIDEGYQKKLLKTVHGHGYKLDA